MLVFTNKTIHVCMYIHMYIHARTHAHTQVAYVESAKDGRHYSVLIRYDQARSRIVKQVSLCIIVGSIQFGFGRSGHGSDHGMRRSAFVGRLQATIAGRNGRTPHGCCLKCDFLLLRETRK